MEWQIVMGAGERVGALLPMDGQEDASNVKWLMNRLRGAWKAWLLGLLIIGSTASLFLWLGQEVWARESFRWDAPIMLTIHSYSAPWLDSVMVSITQIGLPGGVFVVIMAVFWLWYKHHRLAAIALMVGYGGSALLTSELKLFFARPRPLVFAPLTVELDYGFPSGHVMTSVALYGFIAYLCWQQQRRSLAILALLFTLLIAFNRIYLGVHYPSDVLGAFTLGTAWL